ncbi:MAG: hypothetical protein WBM14_17490 [Terracidiphilus sp.]|jgi:hypothetical protein
MPQDAQSKTAYEAAYRHLETERLNIMGELGPLNARLKEVLGMQASLLKRINPDTPSPNINISRPTQKYTRISVRWAILDLLNQFPNGMSTSEIAEALKAGGVQSEAANFANNVSAVLTTTMKTKQEVLPLPDGKWKLSLIGESAISHIQSSEKFMRACGPLSN